jgi:hypothetical protein
MRVLALALLATSSALAGPTWQWGGATTEISGNADAQTRATSNPDTAKESPYFQNWDNDQFSVGSLNLASKTSWQKARLEFNGFGRHAQSELYRDDFLAPRFMNFPNRLVARDLFGLQHYAETQTSRSDVVLNKANVEYDAESARFTLGRQYINYGIGESFNPINPFNQPLGLVGAANVAQGNDGGRAAFFLSERSTLEFFLFGDKQYDRDVITRTAWLHWEWRPTDEWQVDAVIGEDQERNKSGFQINRIVGDGMVFTQALYSSAQLDNLPGEELWDVLVGYDNQFTSEWHVRLEGGYQERDDEIGLADLTRLNGRFFPFEYFVSFANQYEAHPLLNLSGSLIHDVKTNFGYFVGKATWAFKDDWEWDLFVFAPVYQNSAESTAIQELITTDVGTALRVFF